MNNIEFISDTRVPSLRALVRTAAIYTFFQTVRSPLASLFPGSAAFLKMI